MAKRYTDVPAGYKLVFCRYKKDPRTGRYIYPKNGKCFVFLVPEKK